MAGASPTFAIGNRKIGWGQEVFVIAEVGVNHHGDPALCAQLIEAAAASGADAVKLQTINAEESYVPGTASYTEFRDKSLDDAAMKQMMVLADRLGIILFSTPGDFASLDRMCQLGMPAIKISSGLMTNYPLIAEAGRRGLPMIISTGLAFEEEIALAITNAQQNGSPGIAVLKCTALYPAPDETINLNGMKTLAQRFGLPVGYSDHTLDDLACLSAVALGAMVIEKHFTLDKHRAGADHFISMEPGEFSHMVAQIRRLSRMLGSGRIMPVPAEEAVRTQRHRCLIARRPIAAGDVLSADNVGLKRPLSGAVGLPASNYELVLGRLARKPIALNQPICADDLVSPI
jgi:N,N'-diacetyllegionaminate synthase